MPHTAVEILEHDASTPALRDGQRLSLLEDVWAALTEGERRTISDRMAGSGDLGYGVKAGEGRIGSVPKSYDHKYQPGGYGVCKRCGGDKH